ncbi:MAG: hypothetical protein ABI144_05565 [Gallionella sp.]
MRTFILLILTLLSASSFAEDLFVVEGSKIERPDEVKMFNLCVPFAVTDSEANLFFKNAVPVSYQSEELIIGPCSVFGTVKRGPITSRWAIYIGGSGVIYEAGKDPQWFYCGKKCCAKVGRKVCG